MRVALRTVNIFFLAGALLFFAEPASAKKQRSPKGVVVKWNDVPAAVRATMESNAGGGKVKEVRQETGNGFVFYWAEVRGSDGKWSKIYVKDAGALIRVEADNARNKRKHKPLFGG
jgi:hypothetical protein